VVAVKETLTPIQIITNIITTLLLLLLLFTETGGGGADNNSNTRKFDPSGAPVPDPGTYNVGLLNEAAT